MRKSRRFKQIITILLTAAFLIITEGCSEIGPQRSLSPDQQSPIFIAPTRVNKFLSTPSPDLTNPLEIQQPNCTNQLYYLEDLTIPDGEVIAPGTAIEKKWSVQNSGTCNWNETYTIRLINGPDLGAASPQALIPSRSGSDAVIEIDFIAPSEKGNYISVWQAFDPQGNAFGDIFSIEINVNSN